MKYRPILFSGPMVRAASRDVDPKTQTRRVMKGQVSPYQKDGDWYWINKGKNYKLTGFVSEQRDGSGLYPFGMEEALALCPYGQPGDRLWVRETFYYEEHMHDTTAGEPNLPDGRYSHRRIYRADQPDYPVNIGVGGHGWTPSIHMPRWASRITLEITDIRVQRLQEISDEDAKAEGIDHVTNACDEGWRNYLCKDPLFVTYGLSPRASFASLWQSINGKRPGCSWDDNPWVWAVSFRRVQP